MLILWEIWLGYSKEFIPTLGHMGAILLNVILDNCEIVRGYKMTVIGKKKIKRISQR